MKITDAIALTDCLDVAVHPSNLAAIGTIAETLLRGTPSSLKMDAYERLAAWANNAHGCEILRPLPADVRVQLVTR